VATPFYTIKEKTPKPIEGSPRHRAPPRGCDNNFEPTIEILSGQIKNQDLTPLKKNPSYTLYK